MKYNCSKIFHLAIIGFVFFAASSTSAEVVSTIQIADSLVEFVRKEAIPFVPFEMVDPNTKVPIKPDEIVELANGVKVLASQFYSELNEYEKFFNKMGHTLRNYDLGTLQRIITDRGELERQLELLQELHREFDERVMKKVMTAKELADKIQNLVETRRLPDLLDIYEWSIKSQIPEIKFEVPQVVAGLILKREAPQRPNWNMPIKKQKHWGFQSGNPGTFSAGVSAGYEVAGTKFETGALAHGKFSVHIFHNELRILEAQTDLHAPASGELNGLTEAYFMGNLVYSYRLSSGSSEFGETLNLAEYDKSYDTRFTIGPVLCKAKVGVRGRAYFGWHAGIAPLRIVADAGPGVGADGYAEVSADIFVAGAGAGGAVTILADQLKLEGEAAIRFNDNVVPYIDLSLKGYNDLTALAGRLYAFAFIYVPRIGLPPWRKAQADFDLWNWDGIRARNYVLNYSAQVSPFGVNVQGDLGPEDIAEKEIWNKEVELSNAKQNLQEEVVSLQRHFAEEASRFLRAAQADLNSAPGSTANPEMTRLVQTGQVMSRQYDTYRGILIDWLEPR